MDRVRVWLFYVFEFTFYFSSNFAVGNEIEVDRVIFYLFWYWGISFGFLINFLWFEMVTAMPCWFWSFQVLFFEKKVMIFYIMKFNYQEQRCFWEKHVQFAIQFDYKLQCWVGINLFMGAYCQFSVIFQFCIYFFGFIF